ncbi:MAG: hypothetical protein J6T52_03405 [Bacteroidaceae bacterium]|nr:hypothetical protein [Bacteroidaceae bacterium]
MEGNNNGKNSTFESLKAELDKLIRSNPYILKIIGNCKIQLPHESSYTECDYDSVYKKFRIYDTLRSFLFFIVGLFSFFIILLVAYYFLSITNQGITDPKEGYQKVLRFVYNSTPHVLLLFSFVIGCICYYLRIVGKEDLIGRPTMIIITLILQAIIAAFSSKLNQQLILIICPLAAFFAIVLSLSIVFEPLSSRKLNGTIVSNAKLIQEKLYSINTEIIQESHDQVLNQIKHVEDIVVRGEWNELQKMQSLTVLDSLRLELILNSNNGINLVKDWKYLDLSKKMIDEIISCENREITILGDLSFLSTVEGLAKLVKAINNGNKFNIYFTGKLDHSYEEKAIISNHCQELVNNIKLLNKKDLLMIQNNVRLFPFLSKSFTGIGFIGMRNANIDEPNVKFDRVYAYVSSHLIKEPNIDITRANPFVFSWKPDTFDYFSSFITDESIINSGLNVMIDGESKKRTEILNISINDKKKANKSKQNKNN